MNRFRKLAALSVLFTPVLLGHCGGAAEQFSCSRRPTPTREPDVPYEPSDPKVVAEMIQLAGIGENDLVYDLGCGDGRIVIAAVKRGARGVCVDIDPERIQESRENARRAGVADRITFVTKDLFEVPIADATAVMLFLWPEVNLRLKPKLLQELRPGTRIVSHMHDMGPWKAERVSRVDVRGRSHEVFLWRVAEGIHASPPAP